MEYTFSFAGVEDADEIMEFMRRHWREDHILAKSRELLLYDFREGDGLNIGIAREPDGVLAGIFGYMKYNSRHFPDIAGSLWKVVENPKSPMLGLKLRNFVIDNVLHRFFAAPGAGLQTKPIYRLIGMEWHRMQHYFFLNPEFEEYQIAKIPDGAKDSLIGVGITLCDITDVSVFDITSRKDLELFVRDDKDIVPFKDEDYIVKHFLEYPFREYEVYGVSYDYPGNGGKYSTIFVIRKAEAEGRTVCRMVDYYGDEGNMSIVAAFLMDYIRWNKCEYVDFIAHGFSDEVMKEAGFNVLDFDSDEIIIPNYFEPFERRNVPVYCVSEKSDMKFRQCKADGDQDRPNFV